jgi:hypothetical protein
MYSNKLVAAIKTGGKVLREFGDVVLIPFGTEYSILLKNKNSVRASVKIEIDGKDVSEGASIIINPNDDVEIERFIRNGNLSKGNRFKFIERSLDIENFRGVSPEDGLIRIEFKFEEIQYGLPVARRVSYQSKSWNTQCSSFAASAGITAPGSISDQKFETVKPFALSHKSQVIILRLQGHLDNKYISKSITTRSKNRCQTCGLECKSDAKFCSNCGTSLQII